MKYKYDPEANILAITVTPKPFAYAQEMGDFIVHFDKKDKPVYIEILNADAFLSQAAKTLPKTSSQNITHHFQVA